MEYVLIQTFLIALAAGRTNNFLNSILKDKTLEQEVIEAYDNSLKEYYPNDLFRNSNSLKFKDLFRNIPYPITSRTELKISSDENAFLKIFHKNLINKEKAWRHIQSTFFINQVEDLNLIKDGISSTNTNLELINEKLGAILEPIKENPLLTEKRIEKIQSGRIRNYKVESKGRTIEKKALTDFIESTSENFLFLYGSGGMGKTHLLFDVTESTNVNYIYFLAHKDSDFLELYNLCFDSTENSLNSSFSRKFRKQIEQESIFLIVDDFYEVSDKFLREVILDLSNLRKGKVIIVSRSFPMEYSNSDSEINKLRVSKLEKEDFFEYINYYYEKSGFSLYFELNSDILENLFHTLKGYPLGIKFIFDLYKNIGAKSTITANLEQFDPENDSSSKIYMDRLLDSVVNHGDKNEMLLLKQLSVFTTPFDKSVVQKLPAFIDQIHFKSLIRKDFIWMSQSGQIELHALVRELLYKRNDNKETLNSIAAAYYEEKSINSNLNDVDSFKLAESYYSNTSPAVYSKFLTRQDQLFGTSTKIKTFINENVKSSIDRLEYRIQLYPQVLDAYTELVLILIAKKDFKKAEKYLDLGLSIDPKNRYLRLNKARLEKFLNNLLGAKKWLEPLAKEGHIHARNEIGILYREWKKFPEAEKWLLKAIEQGNMPSINEIGILYREWKKFPEAEKWLEPLAKEGNILARNEIGILYREWKKFPEAEKWLEPLAKEGNILARNEIGILYREWKKFPEAEKWLLKAIEQGNMPSINEIGILYREWKKFPEAEKWLEPLAKEGHIHARNEIGILYREWKKFPEAEKWLEPLAKEGNILARNEIGILYREWKKFPEAEKWLLKAIEQGNMPSINEIGILYREWKKFPEAEKWLEPLAKEGHIHARNEIGILYREWKKFPEAEKWLEPLAKEGNFLACNEIAILYKIWGIKNYEVVDESKLVKSVSWYRKAILINEKNIQSYDGIARVLIYLKRYEEAEKFLILGLEIKKKDWRIQKQLIELMIYKVRDKEKALKYLTTLKSNNRFEDKYDFVQKIENRLKYL